MQLLLAPSSLRFCRRSAAVASAARSSKCSRAATEACYAEYRTNTPRLFARREKWEGYHARNLLLQCHGAGRFPATR